MEDIEDVPPQRLRAIVSQTTIPILIRRGKGHQLRVRLPYHLMNNGWLSASGRNRPVWDAKKRVWEVPQAWFDDLVKRCLARYGKVYVIQPYRPQEVCARRCWEAEGNECQCSCMGRNHGSQSAAGQWREVSDTFATRWGDRELACRLITATK